MATEFNHSDIIKFMADKFFSTYDRDEVLIELGRNLGTSNETEFYKTITYLTEFINALSNDLESNEAVPAQ